MGVVDKKWAVGGSVIYIQLRDGTRLCFDRTLRMIHNSAQAGMWTCITEASQSKNYQQTFDTGLLLPLKTHFPHLYNQPPSSQSGDDDDDDDDSISRYLLTDICEEVFLVTFNACISVVLDRTGIDTRTSFFSPAASRSMFLYLCVRVCVCFFRPSCQDIYTSDNFSVRLIYVRLWWVFLPSLSWKSPSLLKSERKTYEKKRSFMVHGLQKKSQKNPLLSVSTFATRRNIYLTRIFKIYLSVCGLWYFFA